MAINREEVLQAAERYIQRGKIEAAIKEYAKVVGEAPTDHNTLNKIGDLYQRQNRLGDAVRYWIQAADVLKSDGFNVRAIAMYKKILRNDATRLDAIESLAELLHKERLVNEARTQYQVLADYYLKHDRTSSAISVLQKMSELEPENPTHHVKLAELFVKQKLPDKALGEYRVIANTMLRRGHAEEAAQVFMRGLDLSARDLDFIGDAIKALRDADQVSAAARFLTAAIERNPEAEQFSRPASRGPMTRSGSRPAVVEPPAPPPPAPAEPEESLVLDLDVDAPPPPTQVMPPPDMAPPTRPPAVASPSAGKPEFEEIEIEIEGFGEPSVPPSPAPPPPPTRAELEAPLEIDWSFAELPDTLPELDVPPPVPGPAARHEAPPAPPPVAQPTGMRIDREALERTAAEVQPQVVRRDEDLIAEAEVLAKYGLKEKALDRLREALQLNPRHLGAHELLLHLLIDLGRPDRAVIVARDLRRLAGEARNQEPWERGRQRLIKAGYALVGDRITPPPERADDAVSQLVGKLTPPAPAKPSPASAAPPTKPAKRGKIDDALAQLASQVLAPAKKKPKPATPPAPPMPASPPAAPPQVELAPPPMFDAPPVPEAAPEPVLELPPVAEEVAWLEEAAPAAPVDRVAEEKLFEDEAQFFDLAAELEKELADESVQAVPLPQPQEQSLEEIVEGFKKGVAENLSAEDYDTHFNLGIAYREMGLLDEAIGEFQLASKAPTYLVECCAMLGVCFLDKGLAVKWYRRALEVPGLPEEQQLGLLYDLGTALLAADDRETAYKAFVEIYGVNSNYRDVVARLEELGRR
jgi:tetratricopeptide (TPR) repeat protein